MSGNIYTTNAITADCTVTVTFTELILNFSIPDTGQIQCYNSAGAQIICNGTGQDGEYNINPFSYTDNGDGTVTDNNTSLMWQKQDDDAARQWIDASTYCNSLALGGYSDWRLPSKKDLISIVDYSIPSPGPTINATYFPNTKSATYWSSTNPAYNKNMAWYVGFSDGNVHDFGKWNSTYARCVRGGQLNFGDFTGNGNGTVTDNATGLMWQQNENEMMTWDNALLYCNELSLGGYSDWRMPNIKELESITDTATYNPAVDLTFFPNIKLSNYWSSTTGSTCENCMESAWYVYFGYGDVNANVKSNSAYIQCVRGGQSEALDNYILSITKLGTGSGTVTANIGELIWSNRAGTATYSSGTQITLIATPSEQSSFTLWMGCSSKSGNICYVSMTEAKTVNAIFMENPKYKLTVTKLGAGTITSDVAGINCPADCGEIYWKDDVITLTAIPEANSYFGGWSGACTGTNPICSVTLTTSMGVKATFVRSPALIVVKSGTGDGVITSDDSKINCGNVETSDCTELYSEEKTVVLTAISSQHSRFVKWAGCSSVKGTTCTVSMKTTKKVIATFTADKKYKLSVTKAGKGTGTIASDVAGINCPGDCSDSYWKDTVVTLTATPTDNSTFSGWSGACTGTNAICPVTMAMAKRVKATFILPPTCESKIPPQQPASVRHQVTIYPTPPSGYGAVIGWVNATIGNGGAATGKVTVNNLQLWENYNGVKTLLTNIITCSSCTDPNDQVAGITVDKSQWRIPSAWSKPNEGTKFQVLNSAVVAPVSDLPNQVYHFWHRDWPRSATKSGAKYYLVSDVTVEGDAMVQIGIDYWQFVDHGDNVEAAVSNWYCAGSGVQTIKAGAY